MAKRTRSSRPYGIRKQDWEEMQKFEYDKKQRPYIPETGVTVLIPPACRCSKHPFAHYHQGEGKFEILSPFEDCRDDQGVKQEIENQMAAE